MLGCFRFSQEEYKRVCLNGDGHTHSSALEQISTKGFGLKVNLVSKTMFQLAVILALAALVNSQAVLLTDDDLSASTPYQFSYSAPAINGGSTHEETGDEYGRKTGSYTVQNEDGSERIVQYVADENGFRASISTNEPGTANQNPADVTIQSSADDGYQSLQSPPAAVIPSVPARRIPTVRQPFNPRRIISRPGQPFLVPLQPTVIPTVVPVDNGRYFPLRGSSLIPQALPIAGDQTVLFPVETFSDDFYQPNIILPPY
ncbi:Cuticle protein 10.9 like protein [Argiope bruennichi]|uniref:Cuticle protein 10.9 like protein n=1 Tax=Argiope bruennichi TaxID=94029 RepID=A0A8T0FPG5_ARGBR|nr:Cuticle protein 10.9 like protein [Argiope bruennichi]